MESCAKYSNGKCIMCKLRFSKGKRMHRRAAKCRGRGCPAWRCRFEGDCPHTREPCLLCGTTKTVEWHERPPTSENNLDDFSEVSPGTDTVRATSSALHVSWSTNSSEEPPRIVKKIEGWSRFVSLLLKLRRRQWKRVAEAMQNDKPGPEGGILADV